MKVDDRYFGINIGDHYFGFSKRKSNKKKKRPKPLFTFLLLFISLLILVTPLVVSAPPFQEQISVGLNIETPLQTTYKQNEDRQLQVHVSNSTNGVFIPTNLIDCFYDLYNSQGFHVIEDGVLTQGVNEFNGTIPSSNLSNIGWYSLYIRCNTTNTGGYIETPFYVNPTGEEITTGNSVLYTGLFIVVLILTILSIVFMANVKNIYIKLGLGHLGYLFLIVFLYLTWNITGNYLPSATFFNTFSFVLFRLLIGLYWLFVIISIIWLITEFRKLSQIKGMIERGVPEDEAFARTIKRGKKKW